MKYKDLIDKALVSYLPKKHEHPKRLGEAMRYAVLTGGKRVRPLLVLYSAEAVGGRAAQALPAACAIEFIHSYSLVHDDLPCMDDDDFRRGKPTCHKKYDEDIAVLAGDALLTLAFSVLARAGQLKVLELIAEAAGVKGMVGGQAVDIEYSDKEPDIPTLEYIHTHKTGALIAVSARVGALLGGADPRQAERLYRYGKHLGYLFQIVDDILDGEGYARVYGKDGARSEAVRFCQKAKDELRPLGRRARILTEFADLVLKREN